MFKPNNIRSAGNQAIDIDSRQVNANSLRINELKKNNFLSQKVASKYYLEK